MFEDIAEQGPAGFLTAVTEQLAKLPSQLWRTDNDGFAAVAAAMDALAVQVDCARVGLVQEAQTRGVVDHSSSPSAAHWLMTQLLPPRTSRGDPHRRPGQGLHPAPQPGHRRRRSRRDADRP